MREIKFRGKSLIPIEELNEKGFEHNDGWFVGNLIQNGDKPWIVGDVFESDPEYIAHEFWIRIHPKSVGQYTGLKDKNGTEIYEGDVVCCQYANFYTPIFRNGIYMAYNVEHLHLTEQEPSTQFNVVWKNGCEVIGNIYENPDLLKEGVQA